MTPRYAASDSASACDTAERSVSNESASASISRLMPLRGSGPSRSLVSAMRASDSVSSSIGLASVRASHRLAAPASSSASAPTKNITRVTSEVVAVAADATELTA